MEDSKEDTRTLPLTSWEGPAGIAANYWYHPDIGTTVAVARASGSGIAFVCWIRRGSKLEQPAAVQPRDPGEDVAFHLIIDCEIHHGRGPAEMAGILARISPPRARAA